VRASASVGEENWDLCNSNERHEVEIANIQALMNNMIDGLLICHSIHTSTFEHLRLHIGKRIPLVQFYRVAVGLPVPQIVAEDEAGAEELTSYLLNKGCRRIAILMGPKELSLTQNRFRGYQNALIKHGLKIDANLQAHVDFSFESVVKALNNWLKLKPEIDAIISISDKSATQIIRELQNKGIDVPKKVRVAGFGNEFVGEIVNPQLTTFDTHTRLIGEQASQLIIEQIITGRRDIITKLVQGKLIVRDSA